MLVPLLTELRISQNHMNNTSSVTGRIRPVGTNDKRHLRLDALEDSWVLDHNC